MSFISVFAVLYLQLSIICVGIPGLQAVPIAAPRQKPSTNHKHIPEHIPKGSDPYICLKRQDFEDKVFDLTKAPCLQGYTHNV